MLQAGQISHLASTSTIKELSALTIDQIVHMARVDSEELAYTLSQRGNACKELLIVLGLGASTIVPLHLTEIGYMLNSDASYPGLFEERKNWLGIGLGGFKSDEPEFPQYTTCYGIEEKYENELRFLIQHRYIILNKQNKSIVFRHPVYHEACKYIFKTEIRDLFFDEKCINMVVKGIGTLNKEVALNTLKFIDSIYFGLQEEEKKSVRDAVFKAIYSIFPSVKDKAISFFDNKFFDLSKEQQKEFIDCVKFQETIDNGGILWGNDEPWYSTSDHRNFDILFQSFNTIDNEILEIIKSKFLKNEYVRPKDAWDYLCCSKILNVCPDNELILKKMLDFSEAFIREKAIYILFEQYAFNYNERSIIRFLNKDEHPNVKYELLRGFLQSCNKYTENGKQLVVNFVKDSMDKISLIIVMQNLLTDFGDVCGFQHEKEEYSEEQIQNMWQIWYELIIHFLNIYPSEFISVNTPHLSNVIEESLRYIKDTQKVVNISEAWCNWIDKTSQYRITDDYANSVLDYLFKGTKNESNIRVSLVERLLSAKKTSHITTNIKYFIDYWELLDEAEIQKVLKVLTSNRCDIKWVKAVAITRDEVPSEVQEIIFGSRSFLSKSTHEILNKIDSELLKACLHVYCGYPQPLWYNGYHHSRNKLWDKLIEEILLKTNKGCFEVAQRELLNHLINLGEDDRFSDGYLIWQELCKSGKEIRKKLFSRLLIETVSVNSSRKQKFWDALLSNADNDERDIIIATIIEDIEAIQIYHHEASEIFEIFNKGFFYKEVLPWLKQDTLIISACDTMLKMDKSTRELDDPDIVNKTKQTYDKFFKKIKEVYETIPPRLYLTNSLILFTISKLDFLEVAELERLVEENRLRIINIGRKLQEKYNDEYEIEDWLF